jgi:FkbH-like protein
MIQSTLAEILKELSPESLAGLPGLNISVLRNITVEAIEPYLKYYSYRFDLRLNCSFGEYDNVYQEAVGGSGELLNEDTECVLVFLGLDNLSADLSRRFPCLDESRISEEIQRVYDFIEVTLSGVRKQTSAMILWFGFELPVYPAMGIMDGQSDNYQTGVINNLNRQVRELVRRTGNAFFVDMNLILSRTGDEAFHDHRYWHIGRAPYTRQALQEIASEVIKYIRPLKGKSRKCLVLDCDNTLWGGIVGEDGLASIKLGTTYPGSPYLEFQQEIVNLYHRGVLIALCSKNNQEDVWEVFDSHPDMVLERKHIAASQINWDDKATNLRKIAADLNIGLDSLVYIDDSEFETSLVESVLPEIETITLDSSQAVRYRDTLASCGFFDTLSMSEEDRKRGSMYAADADREKLRTDSSDMDSYLESLEIVMDVQFASELSIPRVAQLTQKTNQFNLTTRRYSESDIANLSNNHDADVLHARLADRIGDMGIIGACILRYEKESVVIDSFMISCRALGRGVEHAFLDQCLKHAQSRGARTAVGEFIPTVKNVQVKDFYTGNGFVEAAREGEVIRYTVLLDDYIQDRKFLIKEIRMMVI